MPDGVEDSLGDDRGCVLIVADAERSPDVDEVTVVPPVTTLCPVEDVEDWVTDEFN